MSVVDPPPSRGSRLFFAALFAVMFALVTALVLRYELDPSKGPSPKLPFRNGRLTHEDVISAHIALAGIGAVGVLVWAVLRRRAGGIPPKLRMLARGFLALTVFLAGMNYFYVRQGLYASQFAHRWDTLHYLLGPRYYAEIDYEDLYSCIVEDVSARAVPDKSTVRDLHDYSMTTAGELRAEQRCADNFTAERRERWRADLEIYTAGSGPSTMRGAIEDRGYNGSPFHSAIAGYIADRIVLTQATHSMVPLLDIGTLCLMSFAIASAFGWEMGLLFALFYFTNAADRFGIIGGSFFRYQWMVTLGLGLAALRRGRHGVAGIMLALSSLLNVFPVVFTAGVLIRGAVRTFQQKKIPAPYLRFVFAGLITAVLGAGIGALPARGLDNYESWSAKMENHNVERFQGFGTGLKFPFIFRGGYSDATDKVSERTRKQWFHQVRPLFWALATLVLGGAVTAAARTDDDVEASAILGFTLFFTLLGTVGYYFACASVLVLGLHRRVRSTGGAVFLSLFFVTSIAAQIALYATGYYRFVYNTVLSTGWSLWIIGLLIWLNLRLHKEARARAQSP